MDGLLANRLFSARTRRYTIVVSWVLIAIMVIDMLSSRQTTLKFDENLETIYFLLTVVIGWAIASWLLLAYANKASENLRSKSLMVSMTHIVVTITQFALLGFFVFILFNRDYESLTWYATIITSIIATGLMLVFSSKFLRWYNGKRKNIILLVYALAAISLAATIATDYGAKQAFLQVQETESEPGVTPAETYPIRNTPVGRLIKQDIGPETTVTYFVPPQFVDAYHYLHQVPSTLSFIFSWVATAMTMRYYHRKTGTITFWFLISLILALYVAGRMPDVLKALEPVFDIPKPEWMSYMYRVASVGGNVMFGIAFFLMGKKVKPIQDYLYLAALGFTMIGFAHVSNSLQFTFGAASHSLVMLSGYLFVLGLYGSGRSIFQDVKLRESVVSRARDELELLDSIGRASLAEDVQLKLKSIMESDLLSMVERTGIQPTLRFEDLKPDLEKVILARTTTNP